MGVIVRLVRILVTNDDGVRAPGILALARALDRWLAARPDAGHSAVLVAPSTNFSGASAAVGDVYGLDGLNYERVALDGVEHLPCFGLDAPPALCTIVGTLGGFGPRPDLVLSGVNLGVNVGRSVLHSGTVGACLTASQLGGRGLAVSVQSTSHDAGPFDVAADLAVDLLEVVAASPVRTVLNLNVPARPRSELAGIRQGRISTAGIVKSAADGGFAELPVGTTGRLRLTLGSAVPSLGDVSDEDPDDDGALVAAGYASLTALRSVHEATSDEVEATMRAALAALRA